MSCALLAISSPFGFRFLFLLWYTFTLLCVFPFCCHFLRLSPGFFYLLLLFSFLYSPLLSFVAVNSLRAFPLPFKCSHYLILSFCRIIFLFWRLSLCCFSPVSPFSGSLPPVSRCFLSFLRLYAGLCVVSYSSLFSSFLLLQGLAVFPRLRLLPSCFSLGFSVHYRLPLRCFLLRVPVVFPGWFWCSFQLTLLCCCLSFFLSFIGFSLVYSFVLCCSSYLPRFLYRLLRFLCMGSATYFLVLFQFVRRLSFGRLSCLVSVPAFVLFFSCTVSSSSSPQFFGSVSLFCTLESFQFLCVFLVPVQPFPGFVFHPSSKVLLLGCSFVRAFRACVVFVFGCVGVLDVLPRSPSPASGLGSALSPCSVFLAVLRCPGTPPFPFLRFSCGLSVFFLIPLRFFHLRVSLVLSCGFVYVLLLLLCSHFRFVSSPVCYPPFMGWFLSCFASSSSSACGVSGFLPARSAPLFTPTLMYDIFTATIGIKCSLPVTYILQTLWADPDDAHKSPQFNYSNTRKWGGWEGVVRRTGKYDNIGFIIKNTYWHTYNLYV